MNSMEIWVKMVPQSESFANKQPAKGLRGQCACNVWGKARTKGGCRSQQSHSCQQGRGEGGDAAREVRRHFITAWGHSLRAQHLQRETGSFYTRGSWTWHTFSTSPSGCHAGNRANEGARSKTGKMAFTGSQLHTPRWCSKGDVHKAVRILAYSEGRVQRIFWWGMKKRRIKNGPKSGPRQLEGWSLN